MRVPGALNKGLLWSTGLFASNQALALLQTWLLARHLKPAAWAPFGLAMSLLALASTISALDFDEAWLANPRFDTGRLDCLWSFELLRRLLLLLGLCLVSVPAARFFGLPEPRFFLPALAASYLFAGLQNISMLRCRQRLRLRVLFFIGLTSQVLTTLSVFAILSLTRDGLACSGNTAVPRCSPYSVLSSSWRNDPASVWTGRA